MKHIIDNIDNYLEQAHNVATQRKYGLGVSSVYYVGEELHLNIIEHCRNKYTIIVDIMYESYRVIDNETLEKRKYLLPLKALKYSFKIYEKKKSKNKYYNFCWEQSCLRHIC